MSSREYTRNAWQNRNGTSSEYRETRHINNVLGLTAASNVFVLLRRGSGDGVCDCFMRVS